jgi:hypothetical protein
VDREQLARFTRWVRVMPTPESGAPCWLWTGPLMPNGYGKWRLPGRRERPAHLLSYEHYIGAMPYGLQLDHLCRVRACVNPAHLEPVTASVNTDRQDHANRRKDSCPRGHPYALDEDGAFVRGRDGRRRCAECRRTSTGSSRTSAVASAGPPP